MPLSKNINAYGDVRKIFDAAVERGGVRYKLPSRGAAVHWRQRAYQYRKLVFRQAEENSLIPGQPAETPYDNLVITLDENIVTVKPMEMTGELFDTEDRPIELVDELLDEATAFKKGLLGGS